MYEDPWFWIVLPFEQKEKHFDKYAGDLLLKYSDVSFNLTNDTPLKEYYKIIEYPKNKKVINFLRAATFAPFQNVKLKKGKNEIFKNIKKCNGFTKGI